MVAEVLKDGYYPVTKGTKTSFEYAAFFKPNYHEPDPAKPVIYRLRKAKPPEEQPQLLLRETRIGISLDGSAHYIDVRAMQASDENLAIRMKTEPVPEGSQRRYPWSASIEGVNGTTLLESDEEFMFEAPVDGYGTTYAYDVPYTIRMEDREWHASLTRHYYVKGKDGKFYAHLEIEYDPSSAGECNAHVAFYVNASGSRDLECPTDRSRLPR